MNGRRFVLFALALFATSLLTAQDTRLSNLAIRAQGGGGDLLITGFTIGPGPSKTVLVRAIGPTLGAFGVDGALADPKLEIYTEGAKIAENDNWRAIDASSFASVGAFALGADSRDAAIVTTLAPGSYTAQVTGVGGGSGVALVEVYEITGGATRLVNLSTRAHVGTGGDVLVPGITISPGAGSRRLLIRAIGPTLGNFGVDGVLVDPKLELYSGESKTAENDNWGVPMGLGAANEATLAEAFSQAGAFSLGAGSKDAAMLVNLSAGSYTLQVSGVAGTTGGALVEVYDLTPANQASAGTLYIAQLRPQSAGSSTASGFATILITPQGNAFVNVSFSNLSSEQTAAHLRLGGEGDYVLNLPPGQVTNTFWSFPPVGPHTTADLITALNTGRLSVAIDSAKHPSGELRGSFVVANGSQTFIPPATAPALSPTALRNPSITDAARFLTQATFGPKLDDINALAAQGISAWVNAQMALPASSAHMALLADVAAFPNPPINNPPSLQYETMANWNAVWWKIAITAPDQLRQRVAFALSQILVVGSMSDIDFQIETKVRYYDHLINGAFGNFRELLEHVTLSPAMGFWLSHWANQKTDPVKGTSPDENYARELMQLFTIGLVQLQPDGTLLLDDSGHPIPTYNQTTIAETAKVLTGWAFAINTASTTNVGQFRAWPPSVTSTVNTDDNAWLHPMRHFSAFHDQTQKNIVSLEQLPLAHARPTIIPSGQSGADDLKILLDTLFNHPNTAPFISKQLIQRLVTSNPSPDYVYRVAQVFANDGAGTRGNLGAVVKAILTDYEARGPVLLGNTGYGKIKEPLIRATAFLRALNATAPNGRYLDSWFGDPRGGNNYPWGTLSAPVWWFGQSPLLASTVFNFYSVNYAPAGGMAAAGLVAPELEITDGNFAITVPNFISGLLYRTPASLPGNPPSPSPFLTLDYSGFLPLAGNASALIDRVNLLFCSNQMSASTRTHITTALAGLRTGTTDTERVQTAIHLATVSPDGAIQR